MHEIEYNFITAIGSITFIADAIEHIEQLDKILNEYARGVIKLPSDNNFNYFINMDNVIAVKRTIMPEKASNLPLDQVSDVQAADTPTNIQ